LENGQEAKSEIGTNVFDAYGPNKLALEAIPKEMSVVFFFFEQ
jgi:hypothetical protein